MALEFFFLIHGPLHALKPQRGSDASDSNHMSGWLERHSTVSTDTAGHQRMISEFPVLAIFCQNAAAANQVLTPVNDLYKATATRWKQLGVVSQTA